MGGPPDAGSDGGTGDGAAPPITGDGTAIGAWGMSCSPDGAYACAGHAQKDQLICTGGKWRANGSCTGANNCDTTPGSNAGSCQPIIPDCQGKRAGDVFCSDTDRLVCGIDLVTTARIETCPFLCDKGECTGVCMPTTRRCDGFIPQSCNASGQWQNGAKCEELCTGGACSGSCSTGSKQCNGLVTQSC